MTVTANTTKSGPYLGNGVTDTFDYDFRIDDKTHLLVVKTVDDAETTLTVDDDYSVAGLGQDAGGTITLLDIPATGEKITIKLNLPYLQETELTNQGPFLAEVVEFTFDYAIRLIQQLSEEVGRSVKVDLSSNTDPAALVDDIIEARNDAQTARNGAETAQTGAEAAETNAEGSATLAQQWAANPEDTVVSGGLFSALHYAAKAAASAASVDGTQINAADMSASMTANDGGTLSGVGDLTLDGDFTADAIVGTPFTDVNYTVHDALLSGSTTKTLDLNDGNVQLLEVDGDFTLALSNMVEGQTLYIVLTNGGSQTITWPTTSWIIGDGTTSATFADVGVELQSSGVNRIGFTLLDSVLYGSAS